MTKKPGLLTRYYGEGCPHCHWMEPLVERLEVCEKNARLMRSRDRHSGGVPFFYNDETGDTLCGEAPYSEPRKWALGLKG